MGAQNPGVEATSSPVAVQARQLSVVLINPPGGNQRSDELVNGGKQQNKPGCEVIKTRLHPGVMQPAGEGKQLSSFSIL